LEGKLKICPKCGSENLFNGAQFCKNCGAALTSSPEDEARARKAAEKEQESDFVVTEAPETKSDFLTLKSSAKKASADDDQLEITTTANLLETDASQKEKEIPETSPVGPIGSS
jgi:uncharacterized Zn finger protein (UPF0148 family)